MSLGPARAAEIFGHLEDEEFGLRITEIVSVSAAAALRDAV